ncbi:MAG TPA: VCBS repeat-containing protein, partial [Thermoleophilaceae bacterium]|nr:VCBS repeat-containing protein [Thermoleophilaceae bacterium]
MRVAGARTGIFARAVAALAGALALTAPAAAASTVPVDVLGGIGDQHVVFPPYQGDYNPPGATVADAGDVDGDGVEDTVMVLDGPDAAAWITFSPTALPSTTAAGEPGWSGMRINGAYWQAVAAMGDVNGDGLGDVAVSTSSDIFVVFGRAEGGTVDLNDLGDGGFHIDNVSMRAGYGFGTGSGGSAWENTVIAPAGDQNGDDRTDLAFVDGNDVKVAYTPSDPAGATVDASNLGTGGFTLDTGGTSNFGQSPYVGRLGDLNGDGREDLLVAWTSRAVGVVAPGAGAVVDLDKVADDGVGFELDAPDSYVENGIAVGDQNGDGRRDVALVVVQGAERLLALAYSPDLGVQRTILPAVAGEGEVFDVYNGNVIDVGDQDGDGRADVAFSDVVRLSGTGEIAPINPAGPGGALFLTAGSIIVGSLEDRNGDGKRELVAVHADPFNMEAPPYYATWMLDVFLSAARPVPEEVKPPVDTGDLIEFDATFETAPEEGMRSLAARASVELTRPDGKTLTRVAPKLIAANHVTTRASVKVDPDAVGLVPGGTYTFRLVLENGRGLVGRTAKRSFVFRAPRVRRGTAAADRLIGGAGADVLR